jgi:hypothetical protein
MTKKLKIEFAPGAFDQFEGTQEELDEIIAEITRMAESGEMEENARPIDFDNLKTEEFELLTNAFPAGRTLQ